MNKPIMTVDDYIESFDDTLQPKLIELRKIILSAVPPGINEIISYGMPTYKWHINLIHFGQAKNHIGIYPGPGAILDAETALKDYKTTKGSIHIPNNQPIPVKIIKQLIAFNIKSLQEKQKG